MHSDRTASDPSPRTYFRAYQFFNAHALCNHIRGIIPCFANYLSLSCTAPLSTVRLLCSELGPPCMTATRFPSLFHVSYLLVGFSWRMFAPATEMSTSFILPFRVVNSRVQAVFHPSCSFTAQIDRVHVLRITVEAHREIDCSNIHSV